MTYFLGIDGGGTKTDFVIANERGELAQKVRLMRGSNPWHYGLPAVLSVLADGFDRLAEYKADTLGLVAGISGCFGQSQYTTPIEDKLKEFCPQATLLGDLPISFRAATNERTGIIAIAGTGSSVVQFFSDGSHYVYDAVSVGGRDLGYGIAQAYGRGQVGSAGADFLRRVAPVLSTNILQTTADYYADKAVCDIPRHLSELAAGSPAFVDVQPWIDMAADRWRFKLFGIIKKFLQKEPDAIKLTIVLSGSLWGWEYIRQRVTKPLTQEFPSVAMVYNPKIEPVMGAVRIAQDLYG